MRFGFLSMENTTITTPMFDTSEYSVTRVTANSRVLDELYVGEEIISFGNVVPIPSAHIEQDWYTWMEENWGSLSLPFDARHEDSILTFTTVGPPPTHVLTRLSQMHPEECLMVESVGDIRSTHTGGLYMPIQPVWSYDLVDGTVIDGGRLQVYSLDAAIIGAALVEDRTLREWRNFRTSAQFFSPGRYAILLRTIDEYLEKETLNHA